MSDLHSLRTYYTAKSVGIDVTHLKPRLSHGQLGSECLLWNIALCEDHLVDDFDVTCSCGHKSEECRSNMDRL